MVRQSVGQYVAVVLVLLALSCAAGAEKTHLTLAVWTWQETFERLIDEFEALHPDIEVELIVTASLNAYRDRIPAMYAGNVAPDVAMVHSSDFVAWVGMFQSLDRFIERDGIALDEYFPFSIDAWRWEPGSYTVGHGPLYAMPLTYQTVNMYMYNIEAFDEAGLAYPDDTWTWDTELDAAARLTRDFDGDGTADQVGFSGPGTIDDWWARIWQAGGQFIDLEYTESQVHTPEVMEALNFVVNLRLSGVQVDVGGFVTGKAGLGIGGQWLVGTNRYHEVADFPWGVALHPKHPVTGIRTIGARPDGIGIMAHTKHPDEAWELVKFLTSEEVLGRRAAEEQIAVPHIRAAVDNLYGPSAIQHLNMPRGWELMPNALLDVHPTYHLGPEIGRIRNLAAGLLGRARRGEIAASVAAQQMKEGIDAILRELRNPAP